MIRSKRWLKLIVLDLLGVACIIFAPITGWLPGPGGIPLFILGLTLLSVHHEWPRPYIALLKKYAGRFGDLLFNQNARLQLFYDFTAPLLFVGGVILFFYDDNFLTGSVGVFSIFLAVFIFFGNRHRGHQLKEWLVKLKRKFTKKSS
jgi:hypothetical protein